MSRLAYSPSTHMAISMSSRRTSTCLPTLILIFPARVHSSSLLTESNFSSDHVIISEYSSDYTSIFLPRTPRTSRRIKRLVAKSRSHAGLHKRLWIARRGPSRWWRTAGLGLRAGTASLIGLVLFSSIESFLLPRQLSTMRQVWKPPSSTAL